VAWVGAADSRETATRSPPYFQSALLVKRQSVRTLMRLYPSFFGIGVGRSLDNPKDAALIIYVDRRKVPEQLPERLKGSGPVYRHGRLHVTRTYATRSLPRPIAPAQRAEETAPFNPKADPSLKLN